MNIVKIESCKRNEHLGKNVVSETTTIVLGCGWKLIVCCTGCRVDYKDYPWNIQKTLTDIVWVVTRTWKKKLVTSQKERPRWNPGLSKPRPTIIYSVVEKSNQNTSFKSGTGNENSDEQSRNIRSEKETHEIHICWTWDSEDGKPMMTCHDPHSLEPSVPVPVPVTRTTWLHPRLYPCQCPCPCQCPVPRARARPNAPCMPDDVLYRCLSPVRAKTQNLVGEICSRLHDKWTGKKTYWSQQFSVKQLLDDSILVTILIQNLELFISLCSCVWRRKLEGGLPKCGKNYLNAVLESWVTMEGWVISPVTSPCSLNISTILCQTAKSSGRLSNNFWKSELNSACWRTPEQHAYCAGDKINCWCGKARKTSKLSGGSCPLSHPIHQERKQKISERYINNTPKYFFGTLVWCRIHIPKILFCR